MAPRTLMILAALMLAPVAKADKFWLESPDTPHSAEGSAPAMIEGHLLGEDDTHYHLRVVGGELWLDKSRVVEVEQGGMSLADIEQREQDMQQELAAQTEQRVAWLAEQRRDAMLHLDEVVAVHDHDHEAHEHVEVVEVAGFDPVLGVFRGGAWGHYERMFELRELYDLTRDRRYIKWLRRMRRLH